MNNGSAGSGTRLDTAHVPLETVLDGIPDPVLILDDQNTVIDVNDAAGELFDCRPEALVETSWGECCPPEDRTAFERVTSEIPDERIDRFDSGDPIRVETFAGEYKPVELTLKRIFDGAETLLFCLCREITERVEREQTLRTTIARLEALFEASPVPMAVLDTEGTVERWNRAAEETFGWRTATVIGKFYPLFTNDQASEEVLDKLLDGQRIVGMETTHQGQDGSLVDVELNAQPLRESGEVSSIIISAIDITALKQREQHLSVLHRIMRHSLRNKLNVIYAVGDDPPVHDDSLDRLVRATEELISLSDQAEQINKDLRRVENPVPVALDTMLENLVSEIQTAYPAASVALDADIPPTPVRDIARTVIEELVIHAIKHSPSESPTVKITADTDRRITVSVADDRDGLTAGEKAFLQRGESAALLDGSRLGLAHADILLTEVGGQLSARERPDGTTITVELPRADVQSNRS